MYDSVPTVGHHVLVELFGCEPGRLDDPAAVRECLHGAVRAIGATPVGEAFHRFSPQGVSGVVLIAESHLSCHTWPEAGYVAIDIYTCGVVDPRAAVDFLRQGLGARTWLVEDVVRGLIAYAPQSPVERTRALFDRRRFHRPSAEVFRAQGIADVTALVGPDLADVAALEPIAGERFPMEAERLPVEAPSSEWRWGRHRFALVHVVEAPVGGVVVQCVPHTRADRAILEVLTAHSVDTYAFAAGRSYLLRADTTLHRAVPSPDGSGRVAEARWT